MNSRRHRRPSSRRRRAAALVTAAALAAACGGGDGETLDEPPAATGSPPTDETVADGTAPDGSGAGAPAPGSDGPAPPIALADLAEAAGGAAAVAAPDPEDPPGPADRTGLPGVTEAAATITAVDGTVTGCCLLVAATDVQRQRGLMEVTDLGGYQGMVFVWPEDTTGGFWMRNTPTPLSIAWFDASGDFVSAADMAPCEATNDDCPVYPPDGPYRFAVEVFEGDFDALGVGPGSRLTLGGECAAASAGA